MGLLISFQKLVFRIMFNECGIDIAWILFLRDQDISDVILLFFVDFFKLSELSFGLCLNFGLLLNAFACLQNLYNPFEGVIVIIDVLKLAMVLNFFQDCEFVFLLSS